MGVRGAASWSESPRERAAGAMQRASRSLSRCVCLSVCVLALHLGDALFVCVSVSVRLCVCLRSI